MVEIFEPIIAGAIFWLIFYIVCTIRNDMRERNDMRDKD